MIIEMSWQVNEEVSRDMTGEAESANLHQSQNFNCDLDVCRISPKMLSIHYLVRIWYQKLICSSDWYAQTKQQVSMKSADYFFSNPAHRQTDRKKDHITFASLTEVTRKSAVQCKTQQAQPPLKFAHFSLHSNCIRATGETLRNILFFTWSKLDLLRDWWTHRQTDRQTHRSMHDAPQNSTRLLQWQTTISRPVHAVYTSAASTTTTTTTTTTTSTTTTNTNNLRSCFASLFPVQWQTKLD